MHERIKELALQAGGSHYPDVGGKTLEKFAMLLVKECAKIAFDEYAATDGADSGESAILKHFGVEE